VLNSFSVGHVVLRDGCEINLAALIRIQGIVGWAGGRCHMKKEGRVDVVISFCKTFG